MTKFLQDLLFKGALAVDGVVTLSTLAGASNRMVVANAAGVLSTQAIPTVSLTDTLNSVTTRGNTTTNSITVGGLTTTGITLTNNGNLTTSNQFYGLVTNYTDGIFVGWDVSAVYLGYKMGSLPIHLGTNGTGNFLIKTTGNTILENGKLLVGLSTDNGYNVDVAGTIRSNVYWSNNGTLSAPVLSFNSSNRVVLDVQGYGAVTMATLGVGGQLSVNGIVASSGQHIVRGGTTAVNTPFVSYGIGRPDADYSLTNLAGVGGYYSGTAWYNGLGLSFFVSKGTDITGGANSFEAAKITPDGAFLLGNLAEIGTYDSGSGGTNINSYLQLEGHNSDGYGDGVVLKYSRGTKASPAAVQTGDLLGGYYFKAYTNGDYATQSFIESYVTGQASFAKTNLQFATGNGYNQGGFVWMTLNEDGKLLVANPGQFTDKGDYKLQVNGNSYLGGNLSITSAAGGAIEFFPEGGSNATYSWMRAKLGSGLAPTLAWYGDVSGAYKAYGIYGPDVTYDGLLIYREAPSLADVILMGATRIALPSTQKFVWSSSTNVVDTPDLGLAREAAGLLQINNSSLNTYASLKLLNLTATGLAGSGTRMVTVDSNGLLGSQAIPSGGTGSTTLSGLTDVTITSAANNQLLKYDSGTGKWINWTPNYLTSYTETYLGTVTSVAALTIGTSGTDITSTVATSTTTPVITLNVPDASVTARGVVTTGTQSFAGLKTFRGTTASDGPTLGSELTTTGSGTNWSGSGFATGYTHTTGSTAVLTTGLAAVTGNFYKIVLTVTGRTAGFVQLDFGGYSNFVSGSFTISTRTSSTAALTLTPTTDFNGTVVLSIKAIVSYSAVQTFQNSSGTNTLEYRGTADSIYFGLNAGKNASSVATNNVILGNNAGVGITDGTDIIAIGSNAATITAEVNNIIAIGSSALQNTRGVNNIAIGRSALSSGGISAGNVSIGNFTSTASANIYYTVAIGQGAGYSNTGISNTIIGYDASYHKAAGDGNTIIGYQAGKYLSGFTANTSMSNSILIGYETRPSAISQTNQIIIGYNVIGQGSNTTSIGNSSTTLTYLYGSVQQTAVTSSMIKVDSVGKIVAAVAGTDYLTSVSVSNINATGTPSSTTYLRGDGTWSTISGGAGGTVTSVSVVSANGFAGTVATATATPAITLTTTITGILKGNGTAISAAVAGTDYLTSSDLSGYLTSATAASTYQPLDGDLTAIAALAGTSGFLKKTAANTWTLDTNTYLTSYTEIYQGTVTSVAALTLGTTGTDLSSSVATGTTTPVITLNVPTASASNRGALSAADWSTFNGKQSAITLTTTGNSGAATFSTNTLNIPTYTLAGLGGQASSTNLTSLSGLTYASTSFVKMTAAGTFALDTNTYYLASNPNGYTTNTGTVTTVSVVSANGFAGTVATDTTTPAITLSTTITGLLKGNGTAISAATANTDYLAVNNPVYTGTLSTGTLTYTPANLFLSAQRSQNSFIQAVFQNTNAGATASSDVVVNNNLSTDTTYYGDFGINSSAFTGSGSLALANAVYLTATTGDLVLGTTTSNAVHIVVNSGATDAVTIKTTGQFQLPGYTSTSSFTGTAAGYLAFDSSGNILSVAAPSGGGGYTVTTQTTTYSVTATSGTTIVKGDTTEGTFTITLPTAVGNAATIMIKKTAGTAALVVDGAGTETIDGGLTATLNKINESIMLISDNANWQIV